MNKKFKITKENIDLTLYPDRWAVETVLNAGKEISFPDDKLPLSQLLYPLEPDLTRAEKAEWN
jgi:hypothetical protein